MTKMLIFLTFVLSFFSAQGVVGCGDSCFMASSSTLSDEGTILVTPSSTPTKNRFGNFWPPVQQELGLEPVQEISGDQVKVKNEGEVISFALTPETMKGLEKAFRQTSRPMNAQLGELLNGNVRDGLATQDVEMVHDPKEFSLRAYSTPPSSSPTGTLTPDAFVITEGRQWHLDGRTWNQNITSSEKTIRIVCTLFGPATPFPAFNVPLGHSGGSLGLGPQFQFFNSMKFVVEGSSRPQLEKFDSSHNCVSTINADGNRFWHGHVTPGDFEGHENDIYEVQEHGKDGKAKAYRRIFLVIDQIVVRPKPLR